MSSHSQVSQKRRDLGHPAAILLCSFLPSDSGRRDVVVFDDAVEVEPAGLLEWGGGAVVKKMPGFAVGFPLVKFVAGAGADGESAGGLG